MCARQHGDRCSPKERCADGLYCQLSKETKGVGICKGVESLRVAPIEAKPSTLTQLPLTTTSPIRPPCAIVKSEWSACSASCGVGMSVRMNNDNLECEDVQQTRICFLRPCGEVVKSEKHKKCTPTAKAHEKYRIVFQDCRSVKEHRLKFCSNCKVNRCCYPQITRHRTIEFECSKRERVFLSFMWIKKCQCGHKCYANKIIDS
ncbi:CCN family member 1-like [Octopus sinensis]|uniref:CCN family member 1-like n=1 Tax=Octopus sinensis TaxID=2607531 RepID=A0A6P7S685_9MOLL|nr:CCN family member 1-like [Octopus sinensis]